MSSVGLLDERGYVRLRQGGLSESRIQPHDPDAGSETEVALALAALAAPPDGEGRPRDRPRRRLDRGGDDLDAACRTVVAELEPAVLDVTEEYRGPLARAPRAERDASSVTDGRLLLREAAREGGAYDLIVSQPSHPWVPGAGHLFTREAYRLARSALRPGGVFAQWLNIFNMSRELFQTALEELVRRLPELVGAAATTTR